MRTISNRRERNWVIRHAMHIHKTLWVFRYITWTWIKSLLPILGILTCRHNRHYQAKDLCNTAHVATRGSKISFCETPTLNLYHRNISRHWLNIIKTVLGSRSTCHRPFRMNINHAWLICYAVYRFVKCQVTFCILSSDSKLPCNSKGTLPSFTSHTTSCPINSVD
jgi:hypothetical protein